MRSSDRVSRGAWHQSHRWTFAMRASFLALTWIGLSLAPPLSLAAPFSDDFEDADISDWVVLCGSWTITSGFGGGYAVVSSGSNNELKHGSFSDAYGHYHYDVFLPTDYVADGDLQIQRNDFDFYWLNLAAAGTDNVQDKISRASGALTTVLGCVSTHLTQNSWHAVDVFRFPNGVIEVYTDNEATPKIRASDLGLTAPGSLVLRTHQAGVRFDNVSFTPSLPPNPSPPSPSSCGPLGPSPCNASAPPQCSDGIDNDGNGCADYPLDRGCSSPSDPTEAGGDCEGPPVGHDGPALTNWGIALLAVCLCMGGALYLARRRVGASR